MLTVKGKNSKGALIIEGHVQGLSNTRSLGEAGIPVFVVDKNDCLAHYSKYCLKFFRCPDYLTDEFVSFLIDLASVHNLNGWVLIPSNDHAVFTISKHINKLEQYYKIITPSLDIIENIYDKIRLFRIAENEKIPYPLTYSIKKIEDVDQFGINFPVIIKGRFGLSFYKKFGKKVFLAQNEAKMKEYLKRIKTSNELDNTIIQELIPSDRTNKTISFTSFCKNGEVKTFWMGAKLREHPLRFGTATFAESVYIEECYFNSINLLKALNYTGVCEIEYLKDPRDGKYKLIEINARTWLWVGLAKKCGIDYVKYIFDYLNDIPIIFPTEYRLSTKWINYFTDTVFSIKAILTGYLRVNEYLKSLKGEKMAAVFQTDDVMPGIMFLVLLPYIKIKRA
ncbi:MAG: hypothetical protein GX180_14465 [Enterococcus sp.]|nr:hypothetical protein [Enterococcus sp.]